MEDPIPPFGGQEGASAPPRPRKRPNAKQVVRQCCREIEALLETQAATTAEFCRNEARIGARYSETRGVGAQHEHGGVAG